MARDVTVHFVGNARDLAVASAEASVSVDRFGNATAVAGAKASAAEAATVPWLGILIGIGAAATIALAPVLVLGTTFGLLAGGVVALAAVTGNLGDISGQAAASQQDLATAQNKVALAADQATAKQTAYNQAVQQHGKNSVEAKAALDQLKQSQDAYNTAQSQFNALQAQGQGPIAELIAKVKDMGNALGQDAAGMARQLIEQLTNLIPVVQDLGERLIDWFGARMATMLPIITQIVQVAAAGVMGFLSAWATLVDWFMAHWGEYQGAIGSVFSAIGTGVHFALPLLGLVHEAFVRLGPAIQLIRDHADSLKPLLYILGGLFVVMAASVALTAAAVLLVVAAITAVAAAMSFAVSHIGAVADAFWAVVHAAQSAADAIGRANAAATSVPVIGGVISHLEGRAVGGPVMPGNAYLVGENGPEVLLMGGSGGYVSPNARVSGGGITINVTASPLANPADIGRVVVNSIQEYERRSGKAWRS